MSKFYEDNDDYYNYLHKNNNNINYKVYRFKYINITNSNY